MTKDIRRLIRNYGLDVNDELDTSPFEYVNTFGVRDFLAKEYNKLDISQKELLSLYDKILLNRVKEIFDYLKDLNIWENNEHYIGYWWWHLDKIITKDLEVNIDKNFVIYKDKKYFINVIQPETI